MRPAQGPGVGGLFLYGSVARDHARPDSDVDLLIDPADSGFSIFNLAAVQDVCAEILGAHAEVHDYGGYLRLPDFRRRVGGDLIRVFWRQWRALRSDLPRAIAAYLAG